ncbi:Type IV leader peptidase family protein [Marinomonas aquimarina]|uniref:Type IV leader peptidase family protein n=1 Tax=Marinomonas aquimarina TaxID=295068 RepID=A0A1A8T477_9GAMM|nr:prepilin peptidase [Marinomonas aquimarina]SBS25914.1 Type IV leader peptidase family protein [Marinomonas aquimarina]
MVVLLLLCIMACLLFILFMDVKVRQIKNRYLICLTFMVLLTWVNQPNWYVLPYTLMILTAGFFLHAFNILGAGDTKLLCVISLGVNPEFLVLLIYITIILGGLFALCYLIYGYFTDFELARQRGVPYAVPISISGGALIFLSHIS